MATYVQQCAHLTVAASGADSDARRAHLTDAQYPYLFNDFAHVLPANHLPQHVSRRCAMAPNLLRIRAIPRFLQAQVGLSIMLSRVQVPPGVSVRGRPAGLGRHALRRCAREQSKQVVRPLADTPPRHSYQPCRRRSPTWWRLAQCGTRGHAGCMPGAASGNPGMFRVSMRLNGISARIAITMPLTPT